MKVGILRTVAQVFFLAAFVFLIAQGSVQAWILFLGLGLLLSFLIGRGYCGWVCPMGVLMRAQTWFYQKIGKTRIRISRLKEDSRSKIVITGLRFLMVAAFIAAMVAVRGLGVQINVILYLVIVGVFVSFLFYEDFWHRICPHGAVMAVTARPAIWGIKVDEAKCTGCGRCEKACPSQAIYRPDNHKKRAINNKECLVCFECYKACREEAISYGKF